MSLSSIPSFRATAGCSLACAVLMPLLLGCRGSTTSAPAPAPTTAATGSKLKGFEGSLPSVARLEPSTDLAQFAQLYLADALGGRSPRSLEDMPHLRQELPRVYQAIQSGDYVVRWGADPARAPAGTSRTVLAYVKDAERRGGVAVFLDGNVHNAAPEEIRIPRPDH